MKNASHITPKFVEFIPDQLKSGVLYISRRYATASHLCCCGCEREVVTPLNRAKWRFTERAGKITLAPSIGNWSFPCRSHYWIDANQVQWAAEMAPELILAVQARDRRDAVLYVATSRSWRKLAVGQLAKFHSYLALKILFWRR